MRILCIMSLVAILQYATMNERFRFQNETTINGKLGKTSPETTLFISADFKTIAIALYQV